MQIKLILSAASILALISCGNTSKKEEAPEAAPSEYAIVRAPIGADGQPDLSRAELRSGDFSEAKDLKDEAIADNFAKMGQAGATKTANSVEELDKTSSTDSWYLLPWRNRVANGYPVRSGPYLLPWRRAVANGYPVRAGGYLLPYRAYTVNAYGYYMYGYGTNCGNPCGSCSPVYPTPYY